jgi:hypothetical protein
VIKAHKANKSLSFSREVLIAMNKLSLALFVFCLAQSSFSAPTDTNSIDEKSSTPKIDFEPARNIIEGIYRRAAAQALQTKVTELQTKLWHGGNPVPAAMDILRLTIFSHPAQDAMKKTAEHVLSLMSPEVQKLAEEAIAQEAMISTTPMPKTADKEAVSKADSESTTKNSIAKDESTTKES